MGDMKNPGRGVPLAQGEDNDPFAELADIFEAELAMDGIHGHASTVRPASDHHRSVAPSAAGRARVDAAGRTAPLAPHDQDFDAAFDAAFGDEFASQPMVPVAPGRASHHGVMPVKPEAAEAYQSWIVPRGSRPAAADPTRSAAALATTAFPAACRPTPA